MGVPDDPAGRQGLHCIAYDLRGAGRSDQPGHGYDPDSLADDLAAVKVPALIVHGDSDAMIPFQVSARRTAAAIPHSQLKLYQHASHGLFVSHRQRLNADLIEFIKR